MRKRIAGAAILTLLVMVSYASAATVDGINVHWTSTGNASQTVIFVHGWTSDAASWQGQVPGISQKYRVITLDLPGHRTSEPPRDDKFSMDLFARAVEAVRSEAKGEKTFFVGHSIRVPVLGIHARRSRFANRDGLKLPYSNLVYHEIPDTGHFLMMERPGEFNALLTTFLTKLKL